MSEEEKNMSVPAEAAGGEEPSLAKVVASLAGSIAHPEFPSGDLAGLRRLQPDSRLAPAFWRLLVNRVPESMRRSEETERRWAVLMQAMAVMAPNIHATNRGLGKVLAEMNRDSLEQRMLRLLRSRGRQLEDQLRLMARLLASQAELVNWVSLAWLVLSDDETMRQKICRAIARDYYQAAAR